MSIINEAALAAADIRKGKMIGDEIINMFGSYGLNMNHFANDYSTAFRQQGDTVQIPLPGAVGPVHTDAMDGTDDFRAGVKSASSAKLTLGLKHVSIELTAAEKTSGDALNKWMQQLAAAAVQDIQATLEATLLSGAAAGKVGVLNVGAASAFTKETLTKTIRPAVRRPGAEPHIWLESARYGSIIATDANGFSTEGPHYGFAGVHEYAMESAHLCGFAANPSAIAYASAIPGALAGMEQYTTRIALTLPEVGFTVLYLEWADPNNGTSYGGLFWLSDMTCAKDNSALLLAVDDTITTGKAFGVSPMSYNIAKTEVDTFTDLTTISGTASDASLTDDLTVVCAADWLDVQIVTTTGSANHKVQYKAAANASKSPRSAVVTVLYKGAYTQFTVTQARA